MKAASGTAAVLGLDPSLTASDAERFLSNIKESAEGCWLWQMSLDKNGYGRFRIPTGKRSSDTAHRAAWRIFRGPIPPGFDVDHLCGVKNCVNPDHLEPVTHLENCRRRSARITQCPAGHDYDAANTYITSVGSRKCRACGRARARAARARRRAA